jgi:hypothetical protein
MHRPHLLSTGERNRAKRKPSAYKAVSQLNCTQRQGASEFLFTELYHKQGGMTRPFFEIFQENFSEQLIWKIENFEGK